MSLACTTTPATIGWKPSDINLSGQQEQLQDLYPSWYQLLVHHLCGGLTALLAVDKRCSGDVVLLSSLLSPAVIRKA